MMDGDDVVMMITARDGAVEASPVHEGEQQHEHVGDHQRHHGQITWEKLLGISDRKKKLP